MPLPQTPQVESEAINWCPMWQLVHLAGKSTQVKQFELHRLHFEAARSRNSPFSQTWQKLVPSTM
jgi:hypothetical protein